MVSVQGDILTATAIGETRVTLYVGGMSANVPVRVYADPTAFMIGDEATGNDELYIITKTSGQIAVFGIEPAGADLSLTWASNSTNIVTVDENGAITAKRPGTATITATSQNGIVRTCSVTVCYLSAHRPEHH